MKVQERKQYESLKQEVLWFGKAFLLSEGGREWEKASELKTYTIASWADFYFQIEGGSFEELCNRLSSIPLGTYDKNNLIDLIGGIIKQLGSLDIAEDPTKSGFNKQWPVLTVDSHTMKQYAKQLNELFDLDIVYDAPWNTPMQNESTKVRLSANNLFYRDCLLAVYTQLCERLLNVEQHNTDIVAKLQKENESLQMEITRVQNILDEIRARGKSSLEKLQFEKNNVELELQKLREQQEHEVDLPDRVNLVFKMVLLHKLNFLNLGRWPQSATQEQISSVIAIIMGSEQSHVKKSSIKRYLKALLNEDYEGEKIHKKYDNKVDAFVLDAFPRWRLEDN